MLAPTFIWHSHSDKIIELKNGLELAQAADSKSILILACSQNEYQTWAVDPILLTVDLPIFGGIYPSLIFEQQAMDKGVIIVGFSDCLVVSNISQLDQKTTYLEGLELILENDQNLQSHRNFLMFYDGLSLTCEDFIHSFYDCAGCGVTVVGGGAGSLDFMQRPCIFSNSGLVADTMQFVGLPRKLAVGVDHGWEVLDGPYLVTEAQGSLVVSINYQPAAEFYRQCVESLSGYRFEGLEFYDIAKLFPLGIMAANGEISVRDPIKIVEGGLQCVGNVPANSMINILKSSTESLIAAAKNAAAAATIEEVSQSNMIVFDCVSRLLYLEQSFSDELAVINGSANGDCKVFGVLSLGEVANTKSGAIGLLNKSTAIGRF